MSRDSTSCWRKASSKSLTYYPVGRPMVEADPRAQKLTRRGDSAALHGA
jgi:hypothetical protein